MFLPPYSPDLNPIEQAFSVVKTFLRRNWKDQSLSIIDRVPPYHILNGLGFLSGIRLCSVIGQT